MRMPGQYDGVEVEYVSPLTNKKTYLRYRITADGIVESAAQTPLKVTLNGCRNEPHARDRALLEVRKLLFSRLRMSGKVLADGDYVYPGDMIIFTDTYDINQQDGDIVARDGNNFDTSERITFEGEMWVVVTDSLGNTTARYPASPRDDTDFGFSAAIPAIQLKKSLTSPDGNDKGCRWVGVNGLRIVGNKHKVQTGGGYLIWNCANILTDNIVKEVTDTAAANTLGTRTIDFEGPCSNITIGSIKTNRLESSDEKAKTFFGLINCTDVTCLFTRYIEFTLINGVVSLVKDDYDIISLGGIAFGTDSVQIMVRNHVTDAAIDGCTVYSRAANGVYVQKTAVSGKTITMSFVVSSTGALQNMSTYTGQEGWE